MLKIRVGLSDLFFWLLGYVEFISGIISLETVFDNGTAQLPDPLEIPLLAVFIGADGSQNMKRVL